MKKNILIFTAVLITLSLMAFGIINQNHSTSDQEEVTSTKNIASNIQPDYNLNSDIPDFHYSVGTRFSGIKKGTVDKAKSILDFLPQEKIDRIMSFQSVKFIILDDNRQTDIIEAGVSAALTEGQIKLLRASDYSTNLLVRADYLIKNKSTNTLENSYATPHLTIVPEQQAEYLDGMDALVDYLKQNSIEETSIVQKNKLQPAKLYFKVDNNGVISNVRTVTSSGYPSIDKKMIELIKKSPGKWKPAENTEGKKVDQDLVFFYGIIGC